MLLYKLSYSLTEERRKVGVVLDLVQSIEETLNIPSTSKKTISGKSSRSPKIKKGTKVPKPEPSGSVRHKFSGNTIHVIGDNLPVRKGTRRAEIFALFQDGMGVSDFLSAARKLHGGSPDIQIALDKGYITIA
jgi:hypothetical protein